MMPKSSLVIILILLSSGLRAQDHTVWMIGPMMHVNFGDGKPHTSIALELSYWNYEHIPYSFDCGLEFEKQKIRIYSEAQTGIGIAGLACGPLIEFRTKEKTIKGGIQGSVWGNYFLGFDLRFRHVAKTTYVAPGVYGKLPIASGESSSGSHHHHHWHWDD